MKFKLLALTLLLLSTGCDLLLQLLDKTPPTCIILSPPDSSLVSGVVHIQVEANDSNGIAAIDLYTDNSLAATESSATADFEWDTGQFEPGSWHRLFCIAIDHAGNKGSSDTLHLQIAALGPKSIFHGKITLNNNYYRWIEFDARPGKKISGTARAVNGTISRLSLLDTINFQKYRQNQTYNPLFEEQNTTEASINYQFTISGAYYIVLLNTTGSQKTYWLRFTLE
jgi:hypothetical protein|uniref:Uncharacterized protein n=1 Tax=candidate division WOR-3 bacterium TaxID=2052148 RepID=A0A7V3PTT7_UNCW3